MSQPINWPPMRRSPRPPRSPSPRSRWLLYLIIAVVALVFFFGQTVLGYYMDALWFGALGYFDVFRTTLSLQWLVFAVFAVATFLILYGSFRALKRAHADDLPSEHAILVGGQPISLPVEPVLRWGGLVGPS